MERTGRSRSRSFSSTFSSRNKSRSRNREESEKRDAGRCRSCTWHDNEKEPENDDVQSRISRSRSRSRGPDQGTRMQFMPSLRHKALNQEKEKAQHQNPSTRSTSRSRGGSRSESRGRDLSTSTTFSKRQKERDKIVFEGQPSPRKQAAGNGACLMELMPSLRHKKATSPRPDKSCKDQGTRGRSRSRNRCRSLSSTFASRSRSTSRSRTEGPKTGEDKREVEPRRNRSRSVSWGRDNLGDGKTSTRYPHLKPAIKKPDADTITVPIQRSFGGQFRKQEEEKHQQSLSSSTEASVHPPWRYGAEMSSMNSSSAEMSVSQKSSTIRRSQLEQRERRVSALKTWPSTTTKPECKSAGQGQAGEVLHFPVTLSDCRNCKDSRQGHHVPGDPECVIQNMEKIKEEVKKKLRSMGKHGDFEIEEVKDNANGKLVYHMESRGKWQKNAQKTHIFA